MCLNCWVSYFDQKINNTSLHVYTVGLLAVKHHSILCFIVFCTEFSALRKQYKYLASVLDARVTAAHLYQEDALTLKDLQSIQSLKDRPVAAAEKLLNIIMEQPDAVYLCFLDALKQTNQQRIYKKLIEDGYKGEYTPLEYYRSNRYSFGVDYFCK